MFHVLCHTQRTQKHKGSTLVREHDQDSQKLLYEHCYLDGNQLDSYI